MINSHVGIKVLISLFVLLVLYIIRAIRLRPRQSLPPPAPSARKGPVDKRQAFVEAYRQLVASLPGAGQPALSVEQLLQLYPRHYELHGHVAVVQMPPGTACGSAPCGPDMFTPIVAQAFAQSMRPTPSVVLLETRGIGGELRLPQQQRVAWSNDALAQAAADALLERIRKRYWANHRQKNSQESSKKDSGGAAVAGDIAKGGGEPAGGEGLAFPDYQPPQTFAVHREGAVSYHFDVMRVMFSSGNAVVRMSFAGITARDETIIDMFAGIGYFTIPLAVNGQVKRIFAIEKNPDSALYLRLNAIYHNVDHLIDIFTCDNQSSDLARLYYRCDRVLMGYIPSCRRFISTAVKFLKRGKTSRCPKGIIYYHFLANDQPYQTAYYDFIGELGEEACDNFEILNTKKIKSYAPHQYHYIAEVKFRKPLK